jgi:hypothetical protein
MCRIRMGCPLLTVNMHGVAMGSATVDSGSLIGVPNRRGSRCFADDSYHALVYADRFGPEAFITRRPQRLPMENGSGALAIGSVRLLSNAPARAGGFELVAIPSIANETHRETHCRSFGT